MITRLRYPKGYQFFDANGAPLGLGALSYYVAGTTTPQDTYSDSAGAAVNSNPVILDGSGRLEVDVYLGPTADYKEVLASASATVSPWPDDNIPFATQADWNAPSGPNQILNKPALAAVATSGSYTDLSNTPSAFTGDGGTGGTRGLVPAPDPGDAVANKFLSAAGGWATPPGASGSAATNLSVTETADSVGIGSSSGTGVTIQSATLTAAGVLDAARAAKIDGLAAVAASGSYTDLANKPGNMTAATPSAAGQAGLVPAPAAGQNELFLRGDATWVSPIVSTNLGVSGTGDSISVSSSTGTGVTIGAATSAAAGVLDSTRATKIDNLSAVATTGSYTDLSDKPSIPSIPSSLSGKDIDNVGRLGINITDSSNLLSVNAPSVLFSNAGDMRATISKGGASNIAAFNFQDNFSTRVQFGLLGNDSFTIATSPDGGTFNNAVVATTEGAVSFPNTGGFTGDSGSGGNTGLVPAPAAGTSAAGKFLKADGTWGVPPGTAMVMTGATSSIAGSSGLAPAPVAGQQGAFLRGDGTWQQMTPAQVSGLAPSASVDTTNATNITAGTLAAARVGDLSGTYALNSQKGANGGIATLDGSGKLTASQIPASLVGAVVYQGTWNASTNTPTLASGAGTKGYYYKVAVAGTATIDGNSQWNVGDIIIFDGTAWDKIDGISNEVVSVAGLYGVISASGLKTALSISSGDVGGLGSLATQSSVDLSSQTVSGSYPVALTASANTTLALPKEGMLLTSLSVKTYNIKHDRSGDFADLGAAVAYLDFAMPLQGVTLSLDAGQHSYSSPIYIGLNWLKGALIQGVTPITISVTSIDSSSGSSGAWSVVLNVSSTAGVTAGMYAAIYGASGGTNPTFIEGVWPITAVGSGTITVSSTHRAAAAPSGAVTASVGVLSTILKFTGSDGLQVWGGASAINLSNVVLVGDGSAHDGISLQDLGRINSAGIVAVTGFGHYGAYLCLGSGMNGTYLIASGNGSHGICVDSKSVLDISAEIISSGNGGTGIWADEASAVRGLGTPSITLSGNAGDGGFAVNNAIIDPVGAGYSTGNGGYGWHAEVGGRIARNTNADGNNTLGYRALLLPVSYGNLITTPAGGNFEWDGAGLYCSPTSGVRGLVPVYQCSRVIGAGGNGLNNDANAQSFLPPGAQNFPVQAEAIYRFRAKVLLNTGNSNSRTVSSLFATGGGAAFSWIRYSTKAYGSASMGNMNFDWVSVMNAASARTMTSFNSYVWYELQMEGEFVMSSGGTIQPQIQFSAAPGGTNVNMQGSYFELYTYGYNASSAGLS